MLCEQVNNGSETVSPSVRPSICVRSVGPLLFSKRVGSFTSMSTIGALFYPHDLPKHDKDVAPSSPFTVSPSITSGALTTSFECLLTRFLFLSWNLTDFENTRKRLYEEGLIG